MKWKCFLESLSQIDLLLHHGCGSEVEGCGRGSVSDDPFLLPIYSELLGVSLCLGHWSLEEAFFLTLPHSDFLVHIEWTQKLVRQAQGALPPERATAYLAPILQ